MEAVAKMLEPLPVGYILLNVDHRLSVVEMANLNKEDHYELELGH